MSVRFESVTHMAAGKRLHRKKQQLFQKLQLADSVHEESSGAGKVITPAAAATTDSRHR